MIFRKFYFLFAFIVFLASCNIQSNKILKGNDIEAKLKIADKYYAKKKYDKCIPIYEEALTILKGQKNVDEIYYKYANCYYQNGSYELAAFYLRSFYNTYPSNPYAETAGFSEAMCYLKQSPRYSLEQVNTQKAIDVFQAFVDRYPKSEKVADANTKIDELRSKLRKKAYENAYLYYKIGEYHAAAVSFDNFLKDFPEYENPERIAYLSVKALKKFADGSYKDKKEERYKDDQSHFEAFKQKYPNSKYLAELEKMHKKKK
ncbi:MAG: outer membrane protein assembly factor BamD [Chitinophagales bacterium]